MSRCPSEELLAAYAANACEEPHRSEIHAHLPGCEQCRAWLDDARASDTVLADLKRVMDKDDVALPTAEYNPDVNATAEWTLDARARQSARAALPRAIEGYDILQEIGRGGMGAVYLATQVSTKRKVALKVLLEGPFASEKSKRRFEREVELSAQLQHPGIVTILESGISSGRYYFAMQYVEGQRLDAYVADRKPSLADALRLFVKICDAVNYAHMHGVIHRDIKPSNILIDAEGEPHILDFGLAKVSDPSKTDDGEPSLLSVSGQIMGTLPYMSPEQASGSHQNVDIRTDVYSLGVILYEMLTGKYPYTVVGQVIEILRNITETAPARPSTLRHDIDNDVETILLKALAKEKDRRYQSAENLARDIRNYLSGRPIEARRDSTVYILRKLLYRNRLPVSIAAIVLMIVAASLYSWQRQRGRLQRAAANDLMAQFVSNPSEAASRLDSLSSGIRQRIVELADRYVESPAYTERIAGARSGLLLDPAAFWKSIDGGPLWQNGEWLELADGSQPDRIIRLLADQATNGAPREKYVAFCLLGQLAPKDNEVAELCVRTVRSETSPGVVMAARWAAWRLGKTVTPETRGPIYVDDLTHLIFVQVPGCESFRPGSDPSDPDRLDDEDRPPQGTAIPSFFLAATETTFEAFSQFYSDASAASLFQDITRKEGIDKQITIAGDKAPRTAMEFVSIRAARACCAWLNEQAAQGKPTRRYRLPSELEWEYACRGGNAGRFCFGDDANYIRFFARCNGGGDPFHVVAERMPNAYGLFDMHGGVWERCDSHYISKGAPPDKVLYAHRGGASYSPAVRCRSAQRNYSEDHTETQYIGFRLVMEVVNP